MPQPMSREMFRLWAPQQRGRFERVEGVPLPMARQCAAHARTKARVWLALRDAIKGGAAECEALGDGVTVEVDEGTDYQPDAIVNCGARLDDDAFAADKPVVVVEVLSPIVQSIDLHQKLTDYFRVPSIQHYLVVQTRRREVVHHRRDAAGIATRIRDAGSIMLDPPGIALSLSDIYAD